MTNTTEEKAAKLAKQRLTAEHNLKEKAKADDAFRANFERLKAERRMREQASG